jgi:hypothetical protein
LNILVQKDPSWKHEDEYRIITIEEIKVIKPIGCIIGIDVDDEIRQHIHSKCKELDIECFDTAFTESSGELYLYNEANDVLHYPSNDYPSHSNWNTYTTSKIFKQYKQYKYSELSDVELNYDIDVINKKTDVVIDTTISKLLNKSINN